MYSNMNNINYDDFKNICRICLLNCGLNFTQNNIISEVFYKLTGIPFETNDELPQQICLKCFEKINEIHEFAFQCIQTHSSLINSLNNFKTLQFNNKDIKQQPIEEIKIKEERTNELNEDMIPETSEFNNDQNIHDSSKLNICNIKIENEKCYLNEDTKSSNWSSSSEITDNQIENYKFNNYGKNNELEHKHSGERRYTCDICTKAFSKISTLNNHKATHSSERPFECDICGKSFKLTSRLRHHKKVHSFMRPYKCDVCNKTFKCSSNLLRHKKIHSGERPYKCAVCNQSFTELCNLKRHNKVHK